MEDKLVHIYKEHIVTEAEDYKEDLPLKILYHVQCTMVKLYWL